MVKHLIKQDHRKSAQGHKTHHENESSIELVPIQLIGVESNDAQHWIMRSALKQSHDKIGYLRKGKLEIFEGGWNRLPGSIVAANNKDGRHKTIILCKSNIVLLISFCNDSLNPLVLFGSLPSLQSVIVSSFFSGREDHKHLFIYLWIS